MPLNSATPETVVAYSYIRFSTPEQAKGDSLERQLGRSRDWAARHNVKLDESLIDRGVSAFKSKNAAMGHLKGFLDLIRESRIARGSYLLIEALDRLSRDEIWPALTLIGEVLSAGITIVTLSRESGDREYTIRDMNRPDGIFGIILDVWRGNQESAWKSERVSDAFARQRDDARAGISKISDRSKCWLRKVWGEIGGKRRVIGFEKIPKQVEKVIRVYRLALSGLGRRAIERQLNAEGTEGFGDRGWHHSTINLILTDPAVIGWKRLTQREGDRWVLTNEVIEDYYPQIIPEEWFWLVNKATKKGSGDRIAGRPGKVRNLFKGIARCGRCGKSLHYVDKGPSPTCRRKAEGGGLSYKENAPHNIYLICGDARRAKCSNSIHYHYAPLESELLTILMLFDYTRVLDKPEVVSDMQRIEAIRVEIAEKNNRLNFLIEHGELSDLTATTIRKLGDEIKERRQKLIELETAARLAESPYGQKQRDEFVRLALELRETGGTDELRRRVAAELRRVFAAIKADGNEVVGYVSPKAGGLEFHLVDGVFSHFTNGPARWTRDQLLNLASIGDLVDVDMRGLLEPYVG